MALFPKRTLGSQTTALVALVVWQLATWWSLSVMAKTWNVMFPIPQILGNTSSKIQAKVYT